MDETNDEPLDPRAVKLLREIGADMARFAQQHGMSPDEAEDISAKVTFELYQLRFGDPNPVGPALETREQLFSYANTAARNEITRLKQRQKTRTEREVLHMAKVSEAKSEWMNPEVAFEVGALEAAHDEAVKALSPRCQQALYLVRERGMRHREVAAEMGVKEDTVTKLIQRAMAHVRAALQRDYDLPGGRPPRKQIERDNAQ